MGPCDFLSEIFKFCQQDLTAKSWKSRKRPQILHLSTCTCTSSCTRSTSTSSSKSTRRIQAARGCSRTLFWWLFIQTLPLPTFQHTQSTLCYYFSDFYRTLALTSKKLYGSQASRASEKFRLKSLSPKTTCDGTMNRFHFWIEQVVSTWQQS